LLGEIAMGSDPLADKDAEKNAVTVADVIATFMSEHVRMKLAPNTQVGYEATVRLHIPDSIKSMPVTSVTRQDVARLHHSLSASHSSANKTLAFLSKLFNWCEKFGYRPDHTNPCRHIDKFKEVGRQRFLSPAEQARLWEILDKCEAEKSTMVSIVNALRVIMLTGARLREILHLKWDYVDIGRGVLELPKSKTGAKTIYLNKAALSLIISMPKQLENPYVFFGMKPGQPVHDMQKAWQRIRKDAEIEDVRIHDLRHTFASVAVMNGMSLPLIGALLGHSQPRTTARYAHLAAEPLKNAAEKVGQQLMANPDRVNAEE